MSLAIALSQVERNTPSKVKKVTNKTFQTHQDNGVFAYEDIERIFQTGTKVSFVKNGEIAAGSVTHLRYDDDHIGNYTEVNIAHIGLSYSGYVTNVSARIRIHEFAGTKQITELYPMLLDEATEKHLVERGKKFRSLIATPINFTHYDGAIIIPTFFGDVRISVNARSMIDGVGMKILDHRMLDQVALPEVKDNGFGPKRNAHIDISDQELYMTSPFLPTFVFDKKRWGMACVSGFSDIKFDEHLFSKLVMDERQKTLIHSLVNDGGKSFKDIVVGKGGGFVFLLHGEPGVGKTLTAEAISEDIKRPLYVISTGELGTAPDEVESRLSDIFTVASRWNAVVLIDEADVFLEQRNSNDILRNAMVGVFLRNLEYFDGILFLTTNRVKSFDKAFHSRISMSISYNEMTTETRRKVWETLLDAAHITGVDASKLSNIKLNGRQIKNVIRMALTLANVNGEKVTESMLAETSKYPVQFDSWIEDHE